MSVDDMSAEEIDRRFNHWENIDVHFCRHCGSFVSPPDVENGQARYKCEACDRWVLEYLR